MWFSNWYLGSSDPIYIFSPLDSSISVLSDIDSVIAESTQETIESIFDNSEITVSINYNIDIQDNQEQVDVIKCDL